MLSGVARSSSSYGRRFVVQATAASSSSGMRSNTVLPVFGRLRACYFSSLLVRASSVLSARHLTVANQLISRTTTVNGNTNASLVTAMITRGFKNKRTFALKTKKCASKRMRVTGKGGIKCGHAGKRHNTATKSRTQMRRLNKMTHLKGTFLKNMKALFINGK
jgi:ribosomal protein L35